MSATCVLLSPPHRSKITRAPARPSTRGSRHQRRSEAPKRRRLRAYVAEVAEFEPSDAAVDGDASLCVAQLALPFEVEVFALGGEVVTDFVHESYFRL